MTRFARSAPGDLIAVSVTGRLDGRKYLLASFHGDTNGLATLIMVRAVHKTAVEAHGDHIMIFGLDANTYKVHSDKYQGVENFQENITEMGMVRPLFPFSSPFPNSPVPPPPRVCCRLRRLLGPLVVC